MSTRETSGESGPIRGPELQRDSCCCWSGREERGQEKRGERRREDRAWEDKGWEEERAEERGWEERR